MEYKKLKEKFRSRGFDYEQECREGDLAIYKQTTPDGTIRWETIRIRRHNGYTIAGHTFPPAEMYPPSRAWGSLGWTLMTLEDAKKKMEEIQKLEADKETKAPDVEKNEEETPQEQEDVETPEDEEGYQNPTSAEEIEATLK